MLAGWVQVPELETIARHGALWGMRGLYVSDAKCFRIREWCKSFLDGASGVIGISGIASMHRNYSWT
jgi:hypothetical protein